MKQVFALGVAALMASASLAFAQDAIIYIDRDDAGAYRVFGPDDMEGTELLVAANGVEPAVCPEGSYYRNAENMIVACGTGDIFGVGPFEEGAVMATGDPFPATALMLTPTGQPLPGEGDQEGGTQLQSDDAEGGDDAGGDGDDGGDGDGDGNGG